MDKEYIEARIKEIEAIFKDMSNASDEELYSFLKLGADGLREEYFYLISL